MNIDTGSKYTSSSEFEFLSPTDLPQREVKKRTDPDLMAPLPYSEVSWIRFECYGVPQHAPSSANFYTNFIISF